MKKNALMYISKSIIGSIIPVTYILLLLVFMLEPDSFIALPIKGLFNINVYIMDYLDKTFDNLEVFFLFWGIMLAIPSIMIFLNGIFCAYKKIDWKMPIIIILVALNYFSYATFGMAQPYWTVIIFVIHLAGYFLGKRILNKKISRQVF